MHATGRRDFAHGRATMTATGAKHPPVRGRTGNVADNRGLSPSAGHDPRPASVGRRAPRAPRPGPARRRDRAAGPRAVRRARGLGQDDDAGRPGGVAGGRRRGSRVRVHRRVQQAGGRGADGAPGRGAGAAGRGGGLRAGPDVPRPGAGDPARCGRVRGAAGGPGRGAARAVPRHHPGGPRPAGPRVLAAQAGPARDGGRGGAGTRRPGRSPAPSSPTRVPSGSRAASTSTTCWCGRSRACTRTRALLARWRCAHRAAARGRGPGPRPHPAGAGAAAGRARERRLPGRRRRPDGLLAGASPTCGGSSGWPRRCRACGGWTSRRTTAARRRSWPARCGSSSTTASGSPSGSWPGSRAGGRLVLAPDAADDVVRVRRAMASWPADDTTRAVLARTNRELLVAVVAALDLGIPFRAPDLALALEDPRLDGLLDRAEARRARPAPTRLGADPVPSPPSGGCGDACGPRRRCRRPTTPDEPTEGDLATALLGWAAAHPSIAGLRAAVAERRARLAELRRDDAALTLATAHGTKGLEWDHVLVLADGFPGRRAVERRHGARAGPRGGATPRVRRVDARPPLAHPAVRPRGAVAVPARGVRPGGAGAADP